MLFCALLTIPLEIPFQMKMSCLLQNFNGLVVIDEAYIDFSKKQSWVNELDEYPNLVITQTLSKAYGLAGIRLGVCYASSQIIAILNKIKPPYNVNEL
jgi:histidinol-phosphate aminotransferase